MKNTKKTSGYLLNYADETITLSRSFVKKASILNTAEYRQLHQLRKDNEGFEIICPEPIKKESHKALTVEFMKDHINKQADKDNVLAELNAIKEKYQGSPAYFAKTKQWFLMKYPEFTAEVKKATREYEKKMSEAVIKEAIKKFDESDAG